MKEAHGPQSSPSRGVLTAIRECDGVSRAFRDQIVIFAFGKACRLPIVIPVAAPLEIAAGVQYRLIGYECGMFRGPPDWTGNTDVLRKPFAFQTYFVVTEILEPKNK